MRQPLPILPTPLSYTNVDTSYRLNVHTGDWVVVEQDARVHGEALLLAREYTCCYLFYNFKYSIACN